MSNALDLLVTTEPPKQWDTFVTSLYRAQEWMDTNLARIISSKQELVEARHRKKWSLPRFC